MSIDEIMSENYIQIKFFLLLIIALILNGDSFVYVDSSCKFEIYFICEIF